MENNKDSVIIEEMQSLSGVKYSDEQLAVLNHHGGMCILACAGSGKALLNGTGVLTDNGYVPIEKLNIGYTVFDEQGRKQRVLGIYPQGLKDLYEVVFNNSIKITCSGDHLWTCTKELDNCLWETLTTAQLYDEQSKSKLYIPRNREVWFSSQPVPLEPYLLGAYLGGDKSLGDIVCGSLFKSKKDIEIPDSYIYNSPANAQVLHAIVEELALRCKSTSKIPYNGKLKYRDSLLRLCEVLGCRTYIDHARERVVINQTDYFELLDKSEQSQKPRVRRILAVNKLNRLGECTCIKVSGNSELFLTEHCIVTHNTTILTHLIAKRIKSYEIADTKRLLCTTYSKGGAQELEERLNKLLKTFGMRSNITVKTMHALYLSILNTFGVKVKVIPEKLRLKYLNEACKDANVFLDEDDFQTLNSLLSYQINNLLSDAKLVQSYVYTLQDLPLEKYSFIRQRFNAKKVENGYIDFDDMQLYVYNMLCHNVNQAVLDYCRSTWTDVYVDEAQDMSRIQYMILKKIISDPSKLVVIGDDDQCIYEWRGADPSIILNICADFDISRFVLSTNYRCAGNIVERAAVGIVHNNRRSDKQMRPYMPGGDIKICDCGSKNLYEMSKYAYKHIKTLVLEQGVSPSQIAVLSRNNSHLCILNNMLFKDGINCESTSDMKLSKHMVYGTVKSILEMASDKVSPSLIESTLYKICTYMKKSYAKELSIIQSGCGLSLRDILGYMFTRVRVCSDVSWAGGIELNPTVQNKMSIFLGKLRFETIDSLIMIYKILSLDTLELRARGLLVSYLSASAYQFIRNDDKKRTVNGIVDYITEILSNIGYEHLMQYLKVTEQFDGGSMGVSGPKVVMSTMHGAKGKEWDYVVLFADDNISFPSFNGIVRQLDRGVAISDIYNGIDESRRLHYVAFTRAKKQLAIFTDKENTGLHTLESLGLFGGHGSNNGHIVEMAKQVRVYPELVSAAAEEIFNPASKYFYKIDTSDVTSDIGIDYTFSMNTKQNCASTQASNSPISTFNINTVEVLRL